MFSAKQGNYWYHFYNVFRMTRSLTGDWTRDLPHSKRTNDKCFLVQDMLSCWYLWCIPCDFTTIPLISRLNIYRMPLQCVDPLGCITLSCLCNAVSRETGGDVCVIIAQFLFILTHIVFLRTYLQHLDDLYFDQRLCKTFWAKTPDLEFFRFSDSRFYSHICKFICIYI